MSSMPQTSTSPAVSAPLTLALSKGRIFEETLPLLAAAGIEVAEDPETSRKLILPTTDAAARVVEQLDGRKTLRRLKADKDAVRICRELLELGAVKIRD